MSQQQPTPDAPVSVMMFSDYVCPWCYLGNAVIERLVARGLVRLQRLPFPLHPSTPREGLLLSDLFGGANFDAVHQRLYALMDQLDVPHGERDRTYNSRLAQELGMWADTQPGGEKLHGRLFAAYFVDNRNLADHEVLLDACTEAGLDTGAASQVLEERSFRTAVDDAWQQARQLGISGVPTLIAGGYQASGFQPEEELERFIGFVRDKARSPS